MVCSFSPPVHQLKWKALAAGAWRQAGSSNRPSTTMRPAALKISYRGSVWAVSHEAAPQTASNSLCIIPPSYRGTYVVRDACVCYAALLNSFYMDAVAFCSLLLMVGL